MNLCSSQDMITFEKGRGAEIIIKRAHDAGNLVCAGNF